MAGVFLSYSSQDRERVALLAESLRAEGFEVWWDREIPVAVTYEDYIRQQLDSAGAVVVVWSPESVASRYVRWEVRRAERRGVLVPVLIEEADLPPEYFLVQSADLTRWRGDRSDREWRRLVAALVRLVGEPARAEVAEEKPAAAALPAEVAAEVVVAYEVMAPEVAPETEEAVAGEEAAVPPAAIAEEPAAVELEPVPEEAIPIPGVAEEVVAAEPVEGEPAPMEEELGEGAALAEAEVEESLRAWEPVSEEALVAPAPAREEAVEPHRVPPWYRRWWVLAGAGGLLALFVVLALVVRPRGGGEEVTTTTAPGTGWVKVADEGVFGGEGNQQLLAATAWEGGFVVVGSDDSGGDEDAAVWTSADGLAWQRVPHDEVAFGGVGTGDQKMLGVTIGGPGLVAVGWDGYWNAAAVWTSADGETWERVPHDEEVFGGPYRQHMWDIIAGGPGLVAVGWDEQTQGAAVWTSGDGVAWTRATEQEALAGAAILGVTTGGPGLVAVGKGIAAPVWTSADGLTWEPVAEQESLVGTELFAVTSGGPGLVAVGSVNREGAIWTSSDGLTWERVADEGRVLTGGDLTGVAVGADGLVTVGPGGVWTSADGMAWERVSGEPPGGAAVAVGAPGVIVVGGEEDGAAWFSSSPGAGTTTTAAPGTTAAATTSTTIPDVPEMTWARLPSEVVTALMPPAGWGVEFGSGRVAVGSDGSGGDEDAAVYVTSDGVTWERVPHDAAVFGGEGDQVMRAVAVGGPGLVAVGQDGSGGAVWTSADGYTWERVLDESGVFGSAGDHREVWGVTAGGPGLVAVGQDGSYGAVWTSADGESWEGMRLNDEGLMRAVTGGGPGLVAVGQHRFYGAVWVSEDAVTWERLADAAGVFGRDPNPPVMVYSVVEAGPGLVAAGYQSGAGAEDAAVWASVDGLTWERVAHDEALFGGPGRQTMQWLAVVEGLGLVACGEDSDTPEGKAIWVSPPVAGLEWARVAEGTEDFGPGFSESRAVAAGGSGLVAVGVVEASGPGDEYDAAVWTSVNGVGWYRVTGQQSVLGGPGGQGMIDVVAGGPGYVAIGFDNPGDDPWSGDAAVWTSADGIAWARVPYDEAVFGGDGDQQMRAVAVGGPGLVAVGWDGSVDEPAAAAVWTSVDGLAWARVEDQESLRRGAMLAVVAGGPGLVAVGEAAVWTSADGLTWERVGGHEAVFDNSRLCTVAAGGPGLVALGFNWPRGSGEWGDAAVWTSADGTTWGRVPHDDALFSVPYDSLEDCEVVSTDRGLVAVAWGIDHDAGAETTYGALAWFSADGVTWSRVAEDAGIFGGPEEWSGVAGLAVTDEGVVAVGQLDKSVAVWLSPPPE